MATTMTHGTTKPDAAGAFTFVLHSHLPYARRAGRWPHGEEWIHEAATETYLPLIDGLRQLQRDRVPVRLTLGLTPVLVEQLADRTVLENLATFLNERRRFADEDIGRFDREGEPRRSAIARWYRDRFDHLLRLFHDEIGGDIIGAFKALQDADLIEIATSAATHGYLPLMARDSTIRAQIGTGVRAYRRHFGREPRSIWLPECAYRPAYIKDDGSVRPGLEAFVAEFGLKVFFVETHTIEGGRPVGKAAGDVVGPYGEIHRRWVVPLPPPSEPTHHSTYQPYFVTEPRVAAIGRNNRTGMQVWSAEHGYPGEARYREFHKRDGVSGLHYWRVTGPRVDLGDKQLWDPEQAFGHARLHAEHFSELVSDLLVDHRNATGTRGLISAAFDTELFGHWWFEGVDWLCDVLRRLAERPAVELTSAARYVEQHPPEVVLHLPESSWGEGGGHFVWDNAATSWMWPVIHAAEERIERIADRYADADGPIRAIADQAAREALLLQSSDWPFLITTGQARDYAAERFENHVERFNELCDHIEAGDTGKEVEQVSARYYELDNVFPEIDLTLFRRPQPATGAPGEAWTRRAVAQDTTEGSSRPR
jgi:1,4-alpha-glucan branching enzyme